MGLQSETSIDRIGVPWDSCWKDIPDYPGYMVNQYGHIWNLSNNRQQARYITTKGSIAVRLWRRDIRHALGIKKLIQELFGESDEFHMPSMQKPFQGKRPDSTDHGLQKRDAFGNVQNRQSAPSVPDRPGKARRSSNKEVAFLLIPTDEDKVWDIQFYMCGACAHAVRLRDVETHARDEHGASGAKLYSTATEALDQQTQVTPN